MTKREGSRVVRRGVTMVGVAVSWQVLGVVSGISSIFAPVPAREGLSVCV